MKYGRKFLKATFHTLVALMPFNSNAGQGRAGQGRAGQGRARQGRAGQGRAGQGKESYLSLLYVRFGQAMIGWA
jgi:hypothetical protein